MSSNIFLNSHNTAADARKKHLRITPKILAFWTLGKELEHEGLLHG
jgi:hypothetical protein